MSLRSQRKWCSSLAGLLRLVNYDGSPGISWYTLVFHGEPDVQVPRVSILTPSVGIAIKPNNGELKNLTQYCLVSPTFDYKKNIELRLAASNSSLNLQIPIWTPWVCPVFRRFLPTNRSSSIVIAAAVPPPFLATTPGAAVPMASVLVDGRQLCVFADDAQMAQQLVTEVTSAAKENIAKKGSAWTGRRWNMAGDMGRRWELGIVWEYGNSMGRIYGRIWEYEIGHIHMISMNQLSSGGGNGSEGYPSSPNALGEPVGAMNWVSQPWNRRCSLWPV